MKNTLFKTRPASVPTAITVAVSILAMAIAIPASGAAGPPEGPGTPEGKDMQEYTDKQESISKDTLRQSTITGTARISFLNEGRTVPATKVYMKRIESERIMNYKDLSATVPNLFIPEYAAEYPEANRFRNLPSYALFIRHARNVKTENFKCVPAVKGRKMSYIKDLK